MEAFQKKINLMKRKIDHIKSDIECIREDEKTNAHNLYTKSSSIHSPLTTNSRFTKPKPPYIHNDHSSNNTSKQLSYKKHLFIPRNKTAQTTVSNEEPSLSITRQLPQSRTKHNSNNTSVCASVINNNNNNNTTTSNSIAYNFDYRLHNHSVETSFPLRKYNSQRNSARKQLNNTYHKLPFKTKNKKELFRRHTPLPSNTIDVTNSSSINPERVFSPIHNISTANNNSSTYTYTKVSPHTLMTNQAHHRRNKTHEHLSKKTVHDDRCTRNTHHKSDNNAEQLLAELIDISNEYYGDDNRNVTPLFVVEDYKRLLRENKTQNEFITRLHKLCVTYHSGKNSASKRKSRGEGSDMVEIWKWVNGLVKDCSERSGRDDRGCEVNEYQLYCEGVMKEYGLKTINDLSAFIGKLLKKSNKNDNFLEGIKKILMADNKIEEYHK